MAIPILIIAGPTASGKTARAVAEATTRGGEVISVDSRQVYRGLDVGTGKITREEMRGVPHHLLDIRDPEETYSAAEFHVDAARLIREISARGKLPILAGGTHYYFDALLRGLPPVPTNAALREELERYSTEELFSHIKAKDPRRAGELDPKNRRRLVRALEIIAALGHVPPRKSLLFVPVGQNARQESTRGGRTPYEAAWILREPSREELRARLTAREAAKFPRGLVEEVRRVRENLIVSYSIKYGTRDAGERADARLDELGLEYRIVGEYLSRSAHATQDAAQLQAELMPKLSAKLWQYARRQYAWLKKLRDECINTEREDIN